MERTISIPKETRHDEKRVALLPTDLAQFLESSIQLAIEEGAGEGIGISDQEYRNAGASIVSKDAIWTNSTYIAKLLCPTELEIAAVKPGTHVSAFFYAGEHYRLIKQMMHKNLNAYSYEYFEEDDGTFPMMAADGWISGRLAVQNAVFYLQKQFGGRGVVFGGPNNKRSGEVLVIGSGNVGSAAIETALALGANVTVACQTEASMKRCARKWSNIRCILTNGPEFSTTVSQSDMVVGALLISTYDTPALISEDMLKTMQPGAIIVDVTCGYGVGYLPTADKITMPGVGPYERHGVLHLKNPRLPAMTPLSAARNASALYAPYLLGLANSIFSPSTPHPVSARGRILRDGEVVHHHVQSDFDLVESGDYANYELMDHLHEAS